MNGVIIFLLSLEKSLRNWNTREDTSFLQMDRKTLGALLDVFIAMFFFMCRIDGSVLTLFEIPFFKKNEANQIKLFWKSLYLLV